VGIDAERLDEALPQLHPVVGYGGSSFLTADDLDEKPQEADAPPVGVERAEHLRLVACEKSLTR
jgi:hypothetical protein